MTKPIKCNGTVTPRNNFSTQVIDQIRQLADSERPIFDREVIQANRNEMYPGGRFISNSTVVARIESATTEEDFNKNPKEWVWAALSDCAAADYYYTFEKIW